MFIPSVLIAAAAAAQPVTEPARPAQQNALLERRAGRLFISPMGEPFYGRTAGEDGLTVWFERADINHDNVLTAEELAADSDRFFQRLDRNHDREIDPDEITYYEEQVAPQLRVETVVYETRMAGDEVQRHYDDESSSGRFGLLQIPEPVASADANFDRGVSIQEFRNAAIARFQLLDTAHTGRLMLAALENTRHAAGSAAQQRRNNNASSSDDRSSVNYGATRATP